MQVSNLEDEMSQQRRELSRLESQTQAQQRQHDSQLQLEAQQRMQAEQHFLELEERHESLKLASSSQADNSHQLASRVAELQDQLKGTQQAEQSKSASAPLLFTWCIFACALVKPPGKCSCGATGVSSQALSYIVVS